MTGPVADSAGGQPALWMQYVIECEDVIVGPFETERTAVEWALTHRAGRSWWLRPLHLIP